MKQILSLLLICSLCYSASAQVGIGTTQPLARLHVVGGNVLFSEGSFPITDSVPVTGTGRRMMWYPAKSAFRAGYAAGDEWNERNIGEYSQGFGYASIASGSQSLAFGGFCTASGTRCTSFGFMTTASGGDATAFGVYSTASGYGSVAMGGYVSTNNQFGSFILGDLTSGSITNVDAPNQMVMRFRGGYKLFTNSTADIGVQAAPGANAWSTISDIRRKENFATVDAEDFLRKIGKMNLVSWNYKGQSPSEYRHYGPMSQDFYEAFGHDDYGTIGNDTTINQADFDGINMIAIQALENRTTDLKTKNDELTQRILKLEAIILELQKEKSGGTTPAKQ